MSLPTHMPMKTSKGSIQVPTVGFGTWASGENSWCYDATLAALKAGYRHLDCAWNYGVDEAIGAAIRDSGVPRSEIFITSKFWPHFGAPQNVEVCLDLCLKNMGLDYLDLFLAHWPVVFEARENLSTAKASFSATDADKGIATHPDGKPVIDWKHSCESLAAAGGHKGSFVPTWQALQKLVGTGKVRAVGVSNFNIAQLEEVMAVKGSDVPVSCNQVEAHPWLPNNELLEFMQKHDILLTAYSPFAGQKEKNGYLVNEETVVQLAKKHDMGAGQLLQSWAVQRGTVPLGKSQTPERIKANLDVKKLPQEDFDAISGLDRGEDGRTVLMGPRWGVQFY